MRVKPVALAVPAFRIENIAPILYVKDMTSSLSFYVEKLGFRNADWGDEHFTSVHRDHCGMYLCRGGQGNPGMWIWVGFAGDIFALYEQLKTVGVTVRQSPVNYSWAMEMHVEDPDGHILRFGTEPDETRPFLDRKS
ncbi:MAG TPA: VOC family protein [Puia sp.]|nr:VOC family protein [Puia sp.]